MVSSACQRSNFQRYEPVSTPTPLQEPVETSPEPSSIVEPALPLPEPLPPSGPGPIFQECEKDSARHMVAELFVLEPNTSRLPDFSPLTSVKTVCLINLNITDRDFKEGFPGVDGLIEWFALNIRFKLLVPQTGNYEFFLNSDDGSRLFINEKEYIDNDGTHSQIMRSVVVALTAGTHLVRVPYFQGPRYNIALELQWKGPNDKEKNYLPLNQIQRP